MLNSIGNYIKKHPTQYLMGGLTAIISSLLYIVPNYIIQLFVDEIVTSRMTMNSLWQYLFYFSVFAILIYITEAIWVFILFGHSNRYQKELRTFSFRKLVYFRSQFYEKFRSGDLMTRMTSDIDSMGMLLGFGLMIVLADGSMLLSFLAVMFFSISWEVTIVSLIPLIIFGIIIYFVSKEVDIRYEAVRDSVAQLSNEVLEVVDGVRVMRAYGHKELEQERFQRKTQNVVDKANRLAIINGLFGQVAKLFGGLSIAIGLAYCSYLLSKGSLSVGQLVSFQLYLSMLSGSVWGMSEIVVIYQQAKVSFSKIQELLEATDDMEEDGKQDIDSINSIQFNQYSFQYRDAHNKSLNDINFELKKGQTLGIVGKTASGKTTIIKQLLRQYPIDTRGSIHINNLPIQDYRRESLESLIGYVPQEHILFSQTIKYNILFGNQKATEDFDLKEAIANADFTKDIDRMSEGLETLIGEKGVAISGGQKQRVSIARALIRQPDLLILDDSLSAVDAKTEKAIINNIRKLRADKTNIIVTHRLSAVSQADIIIVVEDGRIIEMGNAAELIKAGGWYYAQYKIQQAEGGPSNENI